MSLGPFLRTPFTDLTGGMLNHQNYGKCAEMEMAMMDCLEAYGMGKGEKKCADQMADFRECVTMRKQMQRFEAMRIERHRQYIMSERKKTEHYAEAPRPDSY